MRTAKEHDRLCENQQPRLLEAVISEFSMSGITLNAVDREGVSPARFIMATLKYPQYLFILYEVFSGSGESKHVTVDGSPSPFLTKGYSSSFKFLNVDKIMPQDFFTLAFSQQVAILNSVIDICDVTVFCDDPSFYWQGMSEKNSEFGNVDPAFSGTPGTGLWQGRHSASGYKEGHQLCKHLYSASLHLKKDLPAIVKYLHSRQPVIAP